MSSLEFTPSAAAAMISVGDVVTFEELYARQYLPMVRLAHALVDTQQRAEEVVQDAFAAMYVRYDRLERPEAYSGSVC
jgi:DNA-directed RNA polymerase specialized sigma24 family protein